jgi:lysophospholipase L1-like esterase
MSVPPALSRKSKFVIFGYLLHLALPSLILADIVTSRLQGEIKFHPLFPDGATIIIAAGVSALWLLAGLGLLFAVRNRQTLANKAATPLLSFYSVVVALLLAEAAIRLTGLVPTRNVPQGLLSNPGKYLLRTDPAVMPGVSGLKTVTVNAIGFRGSLPPQGHITYKIVAIGGSTTIDTSLDDSETWPQLLENGMNASQSTISVWVGNAGINGANTVNHLVLTQWLPGVVQSNMWIFLTGVNDLQASLAFEGAPTQAFLEKAAGFQGDLPRGELFRVQNRYPRFERLKLFVLMQQAIANGSQLFHHPRVFDTEFLVDFRNVRAKSAVVPLPDLSTGLKEYRSRLISLASRCRDINERCLFLTQPSIWRNDLSLADQRLLWYGSVGRIDNSDYFTVQNAAATKGFVSAGDLARAMSAYNRTLLDVCQQFALECFDLASHIPQNTSVFYDDVHFNENGARVVAQVLQQYLLSTPPFAAGVTNNSKPASSAALESAPFIKPDHH